MQRQLLLRPFATVAIQNVETPPISRPTDMAPPRAGFSDALILDTREFPQITGTIEESVGDEGLASMLMLNIAGVRRAVMRAIHPKAYIQVIGGYADGNGGNENIIFFGQITHIFPERDGPTVHWLLIAEGVHERLQNIKAQFWSPKLTIGEAIRANCEQVGASVKLPPSAFGDITGLETGVLRESVMLFNYSPRYPILEEVAMLLKMLHDITGRNYSISRSYTAHHPLDLEVRDHNRNDFLTTTHIIDVDLRTMVMKSYGVNVRKVSKRTKSISEIAEESSDHGEEELEFRGSLFFDPRVQISAALRLTDPDAESGIVSAFDSISHSFGGKTWGTEIVGRFEVLDNGL